MPNSSLEDAEKDYSETIGNAPPEPSGSRLRSRWRLALIVAFVAIVASLTAWKIHDNLSNAAPTTKRGSGSGDRAVPVTTTKVETREMPVYLTAPGTVTPYYSVTVRSQVNGQLVSVDVREGQHVRKGQLLARIDPSSYQAAVAQAEGQLSKDQAAAAYANAAAARYKALFAAGVVSQDREQTQVSAAGQAEGALLADMAAIQAAKVNLAFTQITSPIDGVVGLRQVDPGNIVHSSDATGLFLVTQLQPIGLIFTLPEDQLPEVRQAIKVQHDLTVQAYDHADAAQIATGKLLTLDNQIDTATGTDKIKAVFQNADLALFPNQFVNARLILRVIKDALVIPSSAVQTGVKGNFVYVVIKGVPKEGSSGPRAHGEHHNGAHSEPTSPRSTSASTGKGAEKESASESKYYVEVRPITVFAADGSRSIVQDGLAAGESVVTDGSEKLKDGSTVSLDDGASHHGHKGAKGDRASDDSRSRELSKAQSAVDQSSASASTGGQGKHRHSHREKE